MEPEYCISLRITTTLKSKISLAKKGVEHYRMEPGYCISLRITTTLKSKISLVKKGIERLLLNAPYINSTFSILHSPSVFTEPKLIGP